ncbi:uncharacterized protein EKO05_0005054 [Ascochyta rabiei]|uniref:Uncharacterized protein n=1 Tax=Didymella rabiei TaxID=5454 RepID=A0A163BUA6_DIDRA|nr:uncharacterized protein EKO05_0005054 [Ascochyta rabiei]KZM21997.1 hypothetical protein ST47_g6872 [Ascochyta rabiei]UPX14576.1 hypothetical protein EKO05_0005054 [Ascochyta rabiei]
MSWDLNLCMDWGGKVLVPFHYFVQPRSPLSPAPSCQPFPFLNLPIDLQLIIYEHCDAPTLFHLMHTCLRTRSPAAKLFWTNDSIDYWYHCHDSGLFDFGNRDCVVVKHCLEFAQRITRIDVDLTRLEMHFGGDDEPPLFREQASTVRKAQDFWSKVEKAFPAVKRMVLAGCLPRRELPPPPGEFDQDYATIETVVNCAPSHVVVWIAFNNRRIFDRQHCALWQVSSGSEPRWQLLDENWAPTRVLPPVRKFSASPLGDLLTFTRQNLYLMLETRGLDQLKMETYARYAVDGVIRCPRLDCDATFPKRDQWEQHLQNSSHWRLGSKFGYEGEHMMELLYFKHTPETVKAAIEARKQRIDAGYRQTRKLQRRVGCGWNEEGSEQRRLFEEQYFAQLKEENFAAPGEFFMEPGSYNAWLDLLYMYFDPTHIYYAGE